MSAEKKNLRTNPKVEKNQQRKLLAWPRFKPTEEKEQIHEQEVTKTLEKYGCHLRVPDKHVMVLHFFVMDFMAKHSEAVFQSQQY